MATKSEKLKKIEGYVSPMKWDENNDVISIAIVDEDDDSYYVEPEDQESKLMNLMDKKVEVRGKVRTSKGKQYIDVRSFEVIPTDDYDDDDFGDDDDDE